jgi:hypothetical protein
MKKNTTNDGLTEAFRLDSSRAEIVRAKRTWLEAVVNPVQPDEGEEPPRARKREARLEGGMRTVCNPQLFCLALVFGEGSVHLKQGAT